MQSQGLLVQTTSPIKPGNMSQSSGGRGQRWWYTPAAWTDINRRGMTGQHLGEHLSCFWLNNNHFLIVVLIILYLINTIWSRTSVNFWILWSNDVLAEAPMHDGKQAGQSILSMTSSSRNCWYAPATWDQALCTRGNLGVTAPAYSPIPEGKMLFLEVNSSCIGGNERLLIQQTTAEWPFSGCLTPGHWRGHKYLHFSFSFHAIHCILKSTQEIKLLLSQNHSINSKKSIPLLKSPTRFRVLPPETIGLNQDKVYLGFFVGFVYFSTHWWQHLVW